MSEHFAVEVNKENFKKNAKRLNKSIVELLETKLKDKETINKYELKKVFNLSSIQELQAKSLGFNNLNAINKFFDKNLNETNNKLDTENNPINIINSAVEPKEKTPYYFLNNWSEETTCQLFVILLESLVSDSLERQKAIHLINIGIMITYHQKKNTPERFNVNVKMDLIRSNISFDFLKQIALGKYENDIVNKVKSYFLNTLVQDNVRKIDEETIFNIKQHQQSYNVLIGVLEKLEKVENQDALIFSHRWLEARFYREKEYLEKNLFECKDVLVMPANQENLKKIYSYFSDTDWHRLTNEDVSYIYYILPDNTYGNNPYIFKGFSMLDKIKNYENINDTWLTEDFFYEQFKAYSKNKQLKDYYVSDLLKSICQVVNVKKKYEFRNFLLNLLNNYSMVLHYSEDLQKLSKQI